MQPRLPDARVCAPRRRAPEAEIGALSGPGPARGGQLHARPFVGGWVPDLEHGALHARIVGPARGGSLDAVARDEDHAVVGPRPDDEALAGQRLVERVRLAE
jgi:hypothetical protein